jgi:hypothetical protein
MFEYGKNRKKAIGYSRKYHVTTSWGRRSVFG